MDEETKQRIAELGKLLNSKKTVVVKRTGHWEAPSGDGHSWRDGLEWSELKVTKEVYAYFPRERKYARRQLKKIALKTTEKGVRDAAQEQLEINQQQRYSQFVKRAKTILKIVGIIAIVYILLRYCVQSAR